MAFNFDQLADRKSDNSKKWDREFNEGYFGKLPDEYISMWIADLDYEITPIIHKKIEEIVDKKTYGYIYFYDELFEAIKQWQGNKSGFSLNNEIIFGSQVLKLSLQILQSKLRLSLHPCKSITS